jgi:hypothetical protein
MHSRTPEIVMISPAESYRKKMCQNEIEETPFLEDISWKNNFVPLNRHEIKYLLNTHIGCFALNPIPLSHGIGFQHP